MKVGKYEKQPKNDDGVLLIKESWEDKELLFLYDASGSPIGMQYRDSSYYNGVWDTYYYGKNLQGDIVTVYDDEGVKLITYSYNAWGVITATDYYSAGQYSTAVYNPLKYRGYYYDEDLNLYYLATRYYDPEVCRFVTMDDPSYLGATGDIQSYNLYAYCSNNPVMYVDPTGHSITLGLIIGAAFVGVVCQFINDLITSAIEGEFSFSHWSEYVGAAVGGAVGALIPVNYYALSSAVSAVTSTIVSSVSYNIESAIIGRDEYYSDEEIFYNSCNNAKMSALLSFGLHNSKLNDILPSKSSKYLELNVHQFVEGISIFDAVENAIDFPNAHVWDSPYK